MTQHKPLTITSNGKTYMLRPLGFNETARLEEALGETLPMISEGAGAGSMRCIRGVLWAALLRDQPAMTLEDTGKLLDAMGGLDALAGMFADITAPTAAAAKPSRRRK